MQLPILTVPHPLLRQKAKPTPDPTTPKVRHFLTNLKDTLLQAKDPEGVAIAAPQVGQSWRLFITNLNNHLQVYINPQIISQSSQLSLGQEANKPDLEGCLSIPHLYGPVLRPITITIRAQDEKGRFFTQTLSHFTARVVLHEYDHLQGVLFTDYTLSQNQPLYLEQNGQLTQIPNPQEIIKW